MEERRVSKAGRRKIKYPNQLSQHPKRGETQWLMEEAVPATGKSLISGIKRIDQEKQMEMYTRGGEFINRSLSEGKADNEQLFRSRS